MKRKGGHKIAGSGSKHRESRRAAITIRQRSTGPASLIAGDCASTTPIIMKRLRHSP
jgi:hypothetical protein